MTGKANGQLVISECDTLHLQQELIEVPGDGHAVHRLPSGILAITVTGIPNLEARVGGTFNRIRSITLTNLQGDTYALPRAIIRSMTRLDDDEDDEEDDEETKNRYRYKITLEAFASEGLQL